MNSHKALEDMLEINSVLRSLYHLAWLDGSAGIKHAERVNVTISAIDQYTTDRCIEARISSGIDEANEFAERLEEEITDTRSREIVHQIIGERLAVYKDRTREFIPPQKGTS